MGLNWGHCQGLRSGGWNWGGVSSFLSSKSQRFVRENQDETSMELSPKDQRPNKRYLGVQELGVIWGWE